MAKFCDEKIQNHLLNGGKIKRKEHNCLFFFKGNKFIYSNINEEEYSLSPYDLSVDDWEIAEPEYDWDKIIKDKILCIFSDIEDFRYKTISTLRNIENEQYYTKYGARYNHCEPFNPTEFNIAKNLKDYEK